MTRFPASFARNALMLLLTSAASGFAANCQPMQFWPEVDLSITVGRTNLLVPSLARFDSTPRNPQFVATGAIGTFAVDRRWSVSAGYLFAELPQQNQVAHVPLVAITPSWKMRHWTFWDINRFERLMSYSDQPFRYRNRLIADLAVGRKHSVHLYGSNESFVNLSSGSWNQNRAQIGIGFPISRSTRMDGYFLQKSAPGAKETSVLGAILTIKIEKRHRG